MFDTNLDEVMPLEKWLFEFEAEIFDQMILQNCVTQNIDNSGTLFLNNKALKECFMVSLQYMMAEVSYITHKPSIINYNSIEPCSSAIENEYGVKQAENSSELTLTTCRPRKFG